MKIALQILCVIVLIAAIYIGLCYAVGAIFWILVGAGFLTVIGSMIVGWIRKGKQSRSAISSHSRAEKSAEKALKQMERNQSGR
jgi:hypothetical protein